MAAAAPFFREAFPICSNGALPNMKFQVALKAAHMKEPIYYHKQPIEDWAQDASEHIRQVARYYRHCKESEDQKRTTLKKALQTRISYRRMGSKPRERGGCPYNVVRVALMLDMRILRFVFRAA